MKLANFFSFFVCRPPKSQDIFKKCASLGEYNLNKVIDHRCTPIENRIIVNKNNVDIEAYCAYCKRKTLMSVDYLYSIKNGVGQEIPNFRERVVCKSCSLNNRLRATYHLLQESFDIKNKDVYITEEVTPFYDSLKGKAKSIFGSEYFMDKKSGRVFIEKINREVNNEDLTNLSFVGEKFDLVVSLEVLEHVPNYKKAISEIFRVLKRGGSFVFSVPFVATAPKNFTRAIIKNGTVEHLLPAEYHGDPVDNLGCLCFYHFGWEIIEDLKSVGFKEAGVYSYSSSEFGYLGGGGIILYANK